ncbi:MAG: ankyrin repeat domain-containing protein [Gammaproteobacteria bacterium]|nr:ankyrin repeat domain-containing protein [Gammaproteobacteria bacterium]
MKSPLFTRRAVLVTLILMLAGCSPAPSKAPGLADFQSSQLDSPDKARVVDMLDDKGVSIGDRIIVQTGPDSFHEGGFDNYSIQPDRLSLLLSKEGNHSSYRSLSYETVVKIYFIEEGEQVKQQRKATAQLNDAVRAGDIETVEELLEQGADINGDSTWSTPLSIAVGKEDNEAMIELLLEHGADINNSGSSFKTLLEIAINNGHLNNARLLIEAGMNFTEKNKHGRTPYMQVFSSMGYAEEKDMAKYEAFLAYLISKGVDPEERWQDPRYLADNSLGMNGLRLIDMTEAQCFEFLDKNNIEYKRIAATGAVKYPVQVLSPIAGIHYKHVAGSKKHSVMDCRLVVAMAGIGPVLKEFGISNIYHMRAHSHGARVGGKGRTSGHHYALALDIARLVTADGEVMEIKKDWGDRRKNVDPCLEGEDDSDKQTSLRKITCKIAEQGIFHWILTPHYNKAHHDHLHIEIRENVGGGLFQ